MVLAALPVGGGIAALSASHEAVAAHHGNNYLPLCERYQKSHRAVLFALVDAIRLEATSAERSVLDARGGVRAQQVVLLGGGMDSRAFRTDWPVGTRLDLATGEVGPRLWPS
ncbi:hypothetical protein ADL01_32745 [Streptomyces sp. NRRL WC-3618]|nr:hypothetical protein ADL01_32745 [Streptomyces sp. NRRL WC-3618]